jgi:hypothetical protein
MRALLGWRVSFCGQIDFDPAQQTVNTLAQA